MPLSPAAAGDWIAPNYDEDDRKERIGLYQQGLWHRIVKPWHCMALHGIAGPRSTPGTSRLFARAVEAVAKPRKAKVANGAEPAEPTEAAAPAAEAEPSQPSEVVTAATITGSETSHPPEAAAPAAKAWTACPRQGDITVPSDMGRVSPFDVAYACSEIPDKQPDGRAANILLSRVWQQVKVNSDAETCYLGHEFPIQVFRAKSEDGEEQLFTTEPWKLYCLQRAAVARRRLKPVIQPRFIMDVSVIEEFLKDAWIPENFNKIRIVSPDGAAEVFSWERPKTGQA